MDPLPVSTPVFLPMAGVSHEIRDFYWSHGVGQILKDLQDTRHLKQKAEELAELILSEKSRDQDKPIYILANSGGTGLALTTAELLPPQTLERIILLAAAVSPEYDLCPALKASRGGIVSFYSNLDRFVLHWGTWQFGTMDRYYVSSAGCTGFAVPDDPSPEDQELYKGLTQISWQPRMILLGHGGLHVGVHAPLFLINEVAPWLKEKQ